MSYLCQVNPKNAEDMIFSNVPRALIYKEVDDISHFLGDDSPKLWSVSSMKG